MQQQETVEQQKKEGKEKLEEAAGQRHQQEEEEGEQQCQLPMWKEKEDKAVGTVVEKTLSGSRKGCPLGGLKPMQIQQSERTAAAADDDAEEGAEHVLLETQLREEKISVKAMEGDCTACLKIFVLLLQLLVTWEDEQQKSVGGIPTSLLEVEV